MPLGRWVRDHREIARRCPFSTINRSFDSLKAPDLPPVLQGLPAPALSESRISTTLHERVGGLNRGNPSKRTRKTIDRGSGHDAVISWTEGCPGSPPTMRSTLESSAKIPAIARRKRAVSSPVGGILRTCLYANIKVVGLRRDAGGGPHWKRDLPRFRAARGLRRVPLPAVPGADQGSRGERHQGRQAHFWPAVEFQTGVDLNRQADA